MSENMDEVLLTKKRANLKGRLTLFKNYVKALPDILTNELKLELELRISRLESLLDSYNDIQSDIECISSNPTEQLNERDTFESAYYKTLAVAQSKLGMSSGLNQQPPVRRNSSSSEAGSVLQHTRASVKLPVIQLPKFSGAYSNWLEFRDTYTSLIHDNPDLSATSKFHYLRSSLEGSALLVIKSLEFSAANYIIAWKLICDRFDNKKMLVANHVKSLFNVYPMQKETSYNLKKLIDSFIKDIRSLTILGEPTDKWDTLLIHLLSSKFDSQTLFEWEKFKSEHEKQNFEFNDLLQFVRNRSELLEIMEQGKKYFKQPSHHSLVATNNSKHFSCPVCQSDHFIYYCKSFLDLSNKDREARANSLNLCLNCLKPGHSSKKCRLSSCKRCNKKHNSLICSELSRPVSSRVDSARDEVAALSSISLSCAAMTSQGLLSTAVVQATASGSVAQHNDKYQRVRILLDSGSTANFITERLCKQLRLPTRDMVTTINSLDKSISISKKCCDITLYSLQSNFTITITCVIISQITKPWPSSPINKLEIKFPSYITLADPEFYKPSDINILIGNGIFWDLIENEQIKLKSHNITLQKSKLGWIIGGSIQYNNSIYCNFSDTQTLNNRLEKFWELDNITTTNTHLEWSPEERQCEHIFIDTTTRLSNGRFCVTIPLRSSPNTLGDSYSLAKARFLQLENKFKKNLEYKNEYTKFIKEYIKLGHMRESRKYSSDQISYFAPHHGVIRSCSLTTKLRVVFDCSCKSSSGYSFNELQMVGPTIQDDLFSILLRFRQHNIVLTADITKCYRQIEVSESQRSLQQILWRDDPSEPLKAYELCTVTYGTASAPYLATRCLKQLAIECDDQFIKEIISKDFYVDDLITGGSNVDQLVYIYNETTKQLNTGCLPLRKWCSNSTEVLNQISRSGNISDDRFDLCPQTNSKILGINWDHKNDNITFDIKFKMSGKITKRNILSTISQLFDPMGLVSPAILYAKLTLQRLWLLKLNWDEQVPEPTQISWLQFINSLQQLNTLLIPRLVISNKYTSLQLHIFTDASEEAYGACAYIRSVDEHGNVHVHLLCSKNKVAPLKPQTIPRLELCGALLGVRLSEIITKALRLKLDQCFYWTDSSIVLGWISTPTHKLQTFVRNRIAEIQSITDAKSWRYVPTNLNPSDHLTRHMSVGELLNCKQWWISPQFLKDDILLWPQYFTNNAHLPELKQEISCMTVDSSDFKFPFHDFSSYSRMQRVMAYTLRFLHNTRKKNNKLSGPLQFSELQTAIYKLASLSQHDSFPNEFKLLKSNKSLSTKNSLLSLSPLFDTELNLIRVGGRLFNSDYDYSKKHPILLHKKHIFTNLLFNNEHKILMHAGPQHVLYSTRQNFWTIGGRDLARYVYRNCTICNRFRGQTVTPIMGNLPKERFNTTFAFQYTALDYAGPVMIANKEGRGCRLIKSYICVFVCFTTKAIHIELVGNLTTANFLLALKRFISRRGKPNYIYSDNGSNFVGANNELKRIVANHGDSIVSDLAHQSIKFSFCPPRSAHFGGLHESGVKSIKKHLKRVIGNSNLTFEQLYTTLTQIEAILNSRPLCPLSSNPNDLLPLTPGHFLIGKELTSTPEPDYADLPTQRLDRYQRIERLRQQFWSRWHTEYITELQIRKKWKTSQGSLNIGDLVLIKEENQPPLKWLLGRIIQLYPGTDGIARVADIRTSTGVLRRSFAKICPLPTDQDENLADQNERRFDD